MLQVQFPKGLGTGKHNIKIGIKASDRTKNIELLDESILVSEKGVFPLRLINQGLSDLYVIKGEKVAWMERKHPIMDVNMVQASQLKSEGNVKNFGHSMRIKKCCKPY